jgi:L-aspartate oxidase
VCAHHGAIEAGRRVAEVTEVPRAQRWSVRGTRPALETVVFDHSWDAVRRVMWDLVGIVRTDQRLAFAARNLALLSEEIEHAYATLRLSPDLIELRNIALVGSLIVECARRRGESRGLHFNLDHRGADPRLKGKPTLLRRRPHRTG